MSDEARANFLYWIKEAGIISGECVALAEGVFFFSRDFAEKFAAKRHLTVEEIKTDRITGWLVRSPKA